MANLWRYDKAASVAAGKDVWVKVSEDKPLPTVQYDEEGEVVTPGVISELPDLEIDLTPTTIAGGIKTVQTAGTGEALVASTTAAQYVIINALSTNTGIAYIGGTDVDKTTKNGIALTNPADSAGVKAPASCIIPIDDANKIYVDVTVNGEGVQFVVVT